ncbi:hypothetical protein F7725_009397 [Dissostichus mawsoni]|uniref:Uncharacterized protein n=2 Tax=Notothenioidei TaxID=8205 RepID=A0A7J5XM53_DISMA|nr:hypothetical protein F7725_009397 [Dissostichus mawsoni]
MLHQPVTCEEDPEKQLADGKNKQEKTACYRQRVNADPTIRADYLARKRESYHRRKQQGKIPYLKSDEISEREKKKRRDKWNAASRGYRGRKKMEKAMLDLTPPSMENTPPVLAGVEVIQEQQENPGQAVVDPLPHEDFNPPVSSTPERGQRENTSAEKHCKRLQAENHKSSMRCTTVSARRRPFYVTEPKTKDRDTCACMDHENVHLLANKLYSRDVLKTKSISELLGMIVCDPKNKGCMDRICAKCCFEVVQFHETENSREVTWEQWKRVKSTNGEKTFANVHCLAITFPTIGAQRRWSKQYSTDTRGWTRLNPDQEENPDTPTPPQDPPNQLPDESFILNLVPCDPSPITSNHRKQQIHHHTRLPAPTPITPGSLPPPTITPGSLPPPTTTRLPAPTHHQTRLPAPTHHHTRFKLWWNHHTKSHQCGSHADLPVQLEQICAPTFSEMPAWTWLVLSPSCARMR